MSKNDILSNGAFRDGKIKPLSEINRDDLLELGKVDNEIIPFSDRLCDYMKKSRLTNESLAEILNVQVKTISRWRNGITNCSIELLVAMCFVMKLGYDKSIQFINSANISLAMHPDYDALLKYYPATDLDDINFYLITHGMQPLTTSEDIDKKI